MQYNFFLKVLYKLFRGIFVFCIDKRSKVTLCHVPPFLLVHYAYQTQDILFCHVFYKLSRGIFVFCIDKIESDSLPFPNFCNSLIHAKNSTTYSIMHMLSRGIFVFCKDKRSNFPALCSNPMHFKHRTTYFVMFYTIFLVVFLCFAQMTSRTYFVMSCRVT